MPATQRILVLADRSNEVQAALRKASVLARHVGASIELHSCDTEHAWAIGLDTPEAKETLAGCLADSRRYLDALRGSVAAQDLDIVTTASCARSLQDGLTRGISGAQPDLVIKTLAACGEFAKGIPHPLEMQLLKGCAVPLLVTRGRSWSPQPRIVAAVDLDSADLRLASAVVATARRLVEDLGGELEIVYGGDGPQQAIIDRARAAGIAADALRILPGSPLSALREYAAARQIDVLAIGGPDAASWQGATPSLTEALLGAISCDVLIVPRGAGAHSQH